MLPVPLPQPAAPGSTLTIEVKWTAHVPRTFARTGAIGNFFFIAQWFPKLGVLQDEGWNCHQFHFGDRVFLGLRRLRRLADGAQRLDRRRHRRRARTRDDNGDKHDDAPVLPGGRARLRLDDEPRLPRAHGALRARRRSRRSRCGCCCSPSTRPGRAAFRGDARRAQVLRRMVRRLSIRPHHHRRSGVAERRRRHGIPDALHGGHRLAGARAASTIPKSVTVHEAGHQFWYGIVGNNEFEDAWMDEGFNTFSTARAMGTWTPDLLPSGATSAASSRWVFKDIVLDREIDGNRLHGLSRATRRVDAQATPTYRYFPGHRRAHHLQQDRAVAEHAWNGGSAGRRCSESCPPFRPLAVQAPEAAGFFRYRERGGRAAISAGISTRLPQLERVRLRRPGTASTAEAAAFAQVVVRRYGEAIFPVDVASRSGTGSRSPSTGTARPLEAVRLRPRAQARSAQVDPDRVLLLDVNATNNSKTLQPKGPATATKWSLKWMVWLQDCLLSWSASYEPSARVARRHAPGEPRAAVLIGVWR